MVVESQESLSVKKEESASAIQFVFSRTVLKRNLVVALVVGCLLSLTNQLDVLLSQPFTLRLASKLLFNFLVPFTVSSVSAILNRKCP